ncbi:MAG: DNA polymerase III subunit gamma/tau [Endozoicomonadaceae bacterium]|nr:DNA polymerase III subunit gamma/tau [Endozoicomonadaceae bacterium]MCY4330484.1 DNA polymerase III subunit gamma/tau [Endozoicomonadaceae bacterium]
MGYQVLARKWRPRNFNDLVGQTHILKALVNALDTKRLHHAYLFTGTRGVGKTTIARILAKCLNCEQGVSATPCCKCSSCCAIDEGRFVDLIEVDAASRTRVEDTRELLDNVHYAPVKGKFKIYLIDEVHMLSQHSFNALLKTLEEPPPHVKFLLATTDPQKLPITILSRCLQFSLKMMPVDHIVQHLKTVLTKEEVTFEEAGLWSLARAAEGSMRDALSLTEQAISFCNGQIVTSDVSIMLGSIDSNRVFDLIETIISNDPVKMLAQVASLAEHVSNYEAVLDELLSALHKIAIAQIVPGLVDTNDMHAERIVNFASQATPEDIQLFYQSGLIGRKDLPLAPDGRTGFEMVLMRMLIFKLEDNNSDEIKPQLPQQNETLSSTATTLASSLQNEMREHHPDAVSAVSHSQEDIALKKKNLNKSEDSIVDAVTIHKNVSEVPADQVHKQTAATEPSVTPLTPSGQLPQNLSACDTTAWIDLIAKLNLSGVTKILCTHCTVEKRTKNELWLTLDQAYDTLYNDRNHQCITIALEAFFSDKIVVHINSGQVTEETPAMYNERKQKESLDRACQSIYSDENVKRMMTVFDASVDDNSITVKIKS